MSLFAACFSHRLLSYCSSLYNKTQLNTGTLTESASWRTQTHHCLTVSFSLQGNLTISCNFSPSCNICYNALALERLLGCVSSTSMSSLTWLQEATKHASRFACDVVTLKRYAHVNVWLRVNPKSRSSFWQTISLCILNEKGVQPLSKIPHIDVLQLLL